MTSHQPILRCAGIPFSGMDQFSDEPSESELCVENAFSHVTPLQHGLGRFFSWVEFLPGAASSCRCPADRVGASASASHCFEWRFHRFHWNLGLTALEAAVREHSRRGMCGDGANLFTPWSPENKRGKKRCKPQYPSSAHPQRPHFLP